jgi:hypothetical protein
LTGFYSPLLPSPRSTRDYSFEARQMQAPSFAVHIPIVCFGIAFPAFVLLLEGPWLRTGDPRYRTIAKRWSKVMLALFDLGVVTGTILRFELGLLWPRRHRSESALPNPFPDPSRGGRACHPGI